MPGDCRVSRGKQESNKPLVKTDDVFYIKTNNNCEIISPCFIGMSQAIIN